MSEADVFPQVEVAGGTARIRTNGDVRELEYEPFHVGQTMFPCACTLWIHASKDKTPKRRSK